MKSLVLLVALLLLCGISTFVTPRTLHSKWSRADEAKLIELEYLLQVEMRNTDDWRHKDTRWRPPKRRAQSTQLPYDLEKLWLRKQLPEDVMNITEVITYFNYYSVENHVVITDDGYILQIQRIPCSRYQRTCESRPPILLQHGLIDSAHTWVNNLPHESLGFILADEGFDVWLGNSRGNRYSRNHIRLDPEQKAFWEFSWDEMAKYDLPTMINYILKVTGRDSLGYAGHSQGTQIAFARFNDNDEVTNKVNSFVALAPVAYLTHVKTILHTFAKYPAVLDVVLSFVRHGEFLPTTKLMEWVAEVFCGSDKTAVVCTDIIFYITGFDISNMNQTRLPVYLSHLPAGTSVQNMIHYCQTINSNKFQKFDYGREGNLDHYGQSTPPEYSVANFTMPVAIFVGGNDSLATPLDVLKLVSELPSVQYHKLVDYYNHLDFVWGEDAETVIYPDVVEFFKKYVPGA